LEGHSIQLNHIAQLSHRIEEDVIRSDKANHNRWIDDKRREEVQACDRLDCDSLNVPYPLSRIELEEIKGAGGVLTSARYQDAMDVFKQNALFHCQGPIERGARYAVKKEDLNLLLGKHLTLKSSTSDIGLLTDALQQFEVILDSKNGDSNEGARDIMDVHHAYYDGPLNIFCWIRNADQYHHFAMRKANSEHPNHQLYDEHYCKYDPELKQLESILNVGLSQKKALEQILPLDAQGRPTLYRMRKLFQNYESQLDKAAHLLNGHHIYAKTGEPGLRGYDPLKSVENQNITPRSLQLREIEEDGIPPCPGYAPFSVEKNSLEPLGFLIIKDVEFLAKSIPKEFLIARDLFEGEFKLCFENIRESDGNLSITIQATFHSPIIGKLNVFERHVTDPDDKYRSGLYFNDLTRVSKTIDRWNASNELQSELVQSENSLPTKEQDWNVEYLTETIGHFLSKYVSLNKEKADEALIAKTLPVENALTELEGARLLLVYTLSLLYDDRNIPLHLLAGKQDLIQDFIHSKKEAQYQPDNYRNGASSLMSYLWSEEQKNKPPTISLLDRTIQKLEGLYAMRAAQQNCPQPMAISESQTLDLPSKSIQQMTLLNDLFESLTEEFGVRTSSQIMEVLLTKTHLDATQKFEEYQNTVNSLADDLIHFVRHFGPASRSIGKNQPPLRMSQEQLENYLGQARFFEFPTQKTQKGWLNSFGKLLALKTPVGTARENVISTLMKEGSNGQKTIDKYVGAREKEEKQRDNIQSETQATASKTARLTRQVLSKHKNKNYQIMKELSGGISESLWISPEEKEKLRRKYKSSYKLYLRSQRLADRTQEVRNYLGKERWKQRQTLLDHRKEQIEIEKLHEEMKKIEEDVSSIRNRLAKDFRSLKDDAAITAREMEYYAVEKRYRKYGNVWERNLKKQPLIDGTADTLKKRIKKNKHFLAQDKVRRGWYEKEHSEFEEGYSEEIEKWDERMAALERKIDSDEKRLTKLEKWRDKINSK